MKSIIALFFLSLNLSATSLLPEDATVLEIEGSAAYSIFKAGVDTKYVKCKEEFISSPTPTWGGRFNYTCKLTVRNFKKIAPKPFCTMVVMTMFNPETQKCSTALNGCQVTELKDQGFRPAHANECSR